jgi:hypothetical protein
MSLKLNSYFISKDRKIYYNNMTVYIPFEEINWKYKNYTDDEGNLELGSTDSFIFNNTYYIGKKEIDENDRKNILSASFKPFSIFRRLENNELHYNRNVIRDWWKK